MIASRIVIAGLVAVLACAVTCDARAGGLKRTTGVLKPKLACEAISGKSIDASHIGLPTTGATIVSAKLEPGSGKPGAVDFIPEYCSIDGAINPVDPATPKINFHVNVPTLWNQKAWHIGGQGGDGVIPPNLAAISRTGLPPGSPMNAGFPPDEPFPIAQGYAMYGSDSGHQNALRQAPDAEPGVGQPTVGKPYEDNDEAYSNFAYQELKKTHDVAMSVLATMYGTKAKISYFGGQSQGGREALEVVARYPQDYDGVLAMAPLTYLAAVRVTNTKRMAPQLAPGAWVPPAKANTIRDEILRKCDALDGLEDGIINNYIACNRLFDPTITPNPLVGIRCKDGQDTGNDCLSDAQISAIDAIHAPFSFGYPLTNGEMDFPGFPTGAEGATGWFISARPPNGDNAPGTADIRRYLGNPQGFNLYNASMQDIKPAVEAMSKELDVPADWSGFAKRGGKLIWFTPASDYTSNARAQMRLYEQVVAHCGQSSVDRSVRYYISPNVGHTGVGKSARGVQLPQYEDFLTILQKWVEQGVAPPEPIIQTLKDPHPPYSVVRSRPLCRYPQYPRYSGTGDSNRAESYSCTAP